MKGEAQSDKTATLKKLMVAAELLSFRALCRKADVSDWALKQLRCDRISEMRVETLQKIAKALRLSLAELLDNFGVANGDVPFAAASEQVSDRVTALEAEYQRLQAQLESQEAFLRQRFQQEVLTAIEPWLLQWPTVVHAVAKNPDLPAVRLIPLVQPIQSLLNQWGVEAIAPVGSEVSYDPQQHQLMNGDAEPGDAVRIRYAGFVKGDGLLHRAKVSPVE